MASKKKRDFKCPDDMVRHVECVLAGEYDFHMVDIGKPWLVADVGACCGDFALWMRYKAEQNKLPIDTIDCFEPNPSALKFLTQNAKWIGCQVIEAAIVPGGGMASLFYGENNMGESLALQSCEADGADASVRALKSSTLNSYDLIKMDCEGAEYDVVMDDEFVPTARAIMMEYHGELDRLYMIEKLEDKHGYRLSDGKVDRRSRGTLVFYKNEYAEFVRQHLEAQKKK